ncbi:MAG: hypothetical protein U5R31_01015 [Acidimicrobiia bacterium]|nr:hypothetical protein [Acidimicrobiia bacterium]
MPRLADRAPAQGLRPRAPAHFDNLADEVAFLHDWQGHPAAADGWA